MVLMHSAQVKELPFEIKNPDILDVSQMKQY